MIHARTKIIAIISFSLFIVALLGYGTFFWVVEGHKEKLAEERLRVAEADAKRGALSTLEATVLASAEDRAKLNEFILKDEEIIELLSLIERTAKEQGTVVTTDSLTVSPIDDTFERLQVNLNVDGSFDGVMRMLRIIEALPQQSDIPRVGFTKYDEEGVVGWQASIDLQVTKFKKI